MLERWHTRVAALTFAAALIGAGCATPIEIPANAGFPDGGRASDAHPTEVGDAADELHDGGAVPPPDERDKGVSLRDGAPTADAGPPDGAADASLRDGLVSDASGGDAHPADAQPADAGQGDVHASDALAPDGQAGDAASADAS
jgi:hypothetical protein